MADNSFIIKEALKRIDPSLVDKWGDPNKHPETQLTKEEIDLVLKHGQEAFLTHLTKDKFPMVTPVIYTLIDGEIWSNTVRGRSKEHCYRRDPRATLCISTRGLGIPVGGAILIKATVSIVEDRETVERVCRSHAERYYTDPELRELFFKTLYTPNRVALHFTPLKFISFQNIGVARPKS